ncbi:hypothetical protein D3C71_997850 [compost metagenome]
MLHGFALGAERGVTQAGAAVLERWALAKTAATVSTVAHAAIATRATGAIAITRTTIAAVAWTRTTARGRRRILLHAGAVVTAHCHHRPGSRLRCCGRWSGNLGNFTTIGGFGRFTGATLGSNRESACLRL